MYQYKVVRKTRSQFYHSFIFPKKVTEKIVEVEIKSESIKDISYISLCIDNTTHCLDKKLFKTTDNSIIIDGSLFPVDLRFSQAKSKIELDLHLRSPSNDMKCYVTFKKCLDPVNITKAYLYEICDNKLFYRFHKEDYEQLKNLRIYDIDAKIKTFDDENNLLEITEKDFTIVGDYLLLNNEHIDYVDRNVKHIKLDRNEEFGEKIDYVEYEFSSKFKIPQRFID